MFLPVKCETSENFCYFNIAYGLDPKCEGNSRVAYDLEMLTNTLIKTDDLPEEFKPTVKNNKDVKSKDS